MLRCLTGLACVVLLAISLPGCKRGPSGDASQGPFNEFLRLMNSGKNYLDQGDATNALAVYRKAEAMFPNDPDLRQNIANCHLLSANADEAIREADILLQLEPNSAAAYFIKGSALLRLSNPEEAVKALENARRIDPGETAIFFQLGLARTRLQQWDEAITAFQEGITLDPNRLHSAARYLLAQALIRAGRQEEAQEQLQLHQANVEGTGAGAATFERSKFTRARVPFKLDQPDVEGIRLRYVDATREVLGEAADAFSGPVGLLDPNHTGWTSLFVVEPGRGFRLLWNTNGTFHPHGAALPSLPGVNYVKALVGDLQNDRFEDVIMLGDQGSHVFRFETNGVATDAATLGMVSTLGARDGLLMDLDFTGKLDLVAITGGSNNQVQVLRQFGPLQFTNITTTTGVPDSLRDARAILMEDWNRDQHMDIIASRVGGPPLLLEKQRGGPLRSAEPAGWTEGTVFTAGDFDNDLRPDLAVLGNGTITLCFNGGEQKEIPFPAGSGCRQLVAVDHDNDGWLDLWAVGDGIHVWRNTGLAGFDEQTALLGFDAYQGGTVKEVHLVDFDLDCDSDALLVLAGGGLRYFRNDGGNANLQVKINLVGNRSNASGLGCKVEIETGGLRLLRTVRQLPVEVGVGQHHMLDSFLVHWFNWPQGAPQMAFDCRTPLFSSEQTVQEGSCPYLYAWDGERFRFVTDILGAAPLGLPVAPGRHVESDPEELVWIGDEKSFPPRDGLLQLQITEELREVLYLDEAKLVVVDHEPGTEVHPTDKLLPSGPFPPGKLLTLHNEHPLLRATTLDGMEVTEALQAIDGHRVSPPRLRSPQLRGLAEPHGWVLDFGPLAPSRPLVLVLNGWLRFGGGMANIAASHDPGLPFPFPSLEMEVGDDHWIPVDVVVGAPAGKTKTILVDLEGKLRPGARRLRLTGAFEIHWDRIALLQKKTGATTRVALLSPDEADLHFRGFSTLQDLPPDWPLTPDYDQVQPNSCWTILPGGWSTRHGDVSELIAARDEGLALVHSGDELTLRFSQANLPAKPEGTVRQFFLYVDGWDKDSDFHVTTGTTLEPLPWHGMNDQEYGREKRPPFPSDALHKKYNTRWVDRAALRRTAQR